MKSKKRAPLYGIPTRWGLLCFGLFLLLVVVAATYQNNLVFVMAFLIFGLVFPIIRQTAENISGVEILGMHIGTAAAGEMNELQIHLRNSTPRRLEQIQVWTPLPGATYGLTNIAPGASEIVRIHFQNPARRGLYKCPRIQIGSHAPFGVLSVWISRNFDLEFPVSPTPTGNQIPPGLETHQGTEFSSHRPHIEGEGLGRIDWKVLARGGGMKVREFNSNPERDLVFDLEEVRVANLEHRLQQLAAWVEHAFQLGVSYSLKVKPARLSSGRGYQHYLSALSLLAAHKASHFESPKGTGWRRKFFRSLFWTEQGLPINQNNRMWLTALAGFSTIPVWFETVGISKMFLSVYCFLPFLISIPGVQRSALRKFDLEKYLPPILALIGFVITGTAFQWGPSTESAAVLLAFMVLSKGTELRYFGDGIVQILGLNLVVMAGILFTQDLPITGLMVLVVLQSFLVLRNLDQGKANTESVWTSWRRLFRWDLIISVPAIVALFLLFPRFVSPFSKWMEGGQQGIQVGFSDLMDLKELGKLATSQEIAFRVEFDAVAPAPGTLYWRSSVLDSSDGLIWNPISYDKTSETTEKISVTNIVHYQQILEPRFGKRIFALDTPLRISATHGGTALRVQKLLHNQFQFHRPLSSPLRMKGESTLIAKAPGSYSRELKPKLNKIPVGKKISDLVKGWKAKAKSDRDMISTALNYFTASDFVYSPEAPQLTSIDEFLLEKRAGFCEHYASSFAVLMREAGLPSRVVVGFLGGDWNGIGDYMTVRDRHAHAWTEVWLQEEGWTRIDPTSAVSSARGYFLTLNQEALSEDQSHFVMGVVRSIERSWESLDFAYQSFLLGFDSAEQASLLEKIGLSEISKRDWYALLGIFALSLSVLAVWMRGKFQKILKRDRQWKELNALATVMGVPLQKGQALLSWKSQVLSAEEKSTDSRKNQSTDMQTNTLMEKRRQKWLLLFENYIREVYAGTGTLN